MSDLIDNLSKVWKISKDMKLERGVDIFDMMADASRELRRLEAVVENQSRAICNLQQELNK